ncbi:RNA-dependent RNA polymerase 2 [Cocos nucifera]|uniref:RNA-dependent RNA polymerase n=1 Tax=Cocos nucifera TaxID=13894 RepID=A0A8K0MUW0_COCNU|nr:RNA-dependent RNA polymerase 2 [Cocos nucifera]
MGGGRTTVQVSNIPLTAVAQELFEFFDSAVGSVFACEIATARRNWKSRGFGRVQFDSLAAADRACRLADCGDLPDFQGARLGVLRSKEDIIVRAAEARNRVEGATLHAGVLVTERCMEVFGYWDRVRAEIMPEREKLELFLEDGGVRYKLEVTFGDILATFGCRLSGRGTDAILLQSCGERGRPLLIAISLETLISQLHYAPKIYKGISGPTISSKFSNDRYHACKEDFQFLWVRAPDFSSNSSIGRSCYLCLELVEGLSGSEIQKKIPFLGELGELALSMGQLFYAPSKLVPIISCPPEHSVAYEILFQLNSLVHMQKISCGQVNNDLFDILRGLSLDTTMKILAKMHKLKSTCYEPVQFIKNQLANMRKNRNSSSPIKSTHAENIMSCHRVLVTPSKVYFLGPELETSNYVIKHYSEYASDFIRVSFIEEDWGKLSFDAISTSIEQGVFSKPYRTGIYDRILSILKDGIVIGSKKFEFLAFSASQLRSNSIWMFASNDKVTAENIREWMGHFNRIHSVSKCAARMGQLFSSSLQTIDVPFRDVKNISDVTVTTDGIPYCFSDGIGKISLSFARQVAQKCGLSHTPSAFQIRYGGYKGVIAVDRTSFQKLSLRPSMLKFESENTMLCVTKWSEYLPCYLNREIICLLSTLGVEDEVFELMQHDQMSLLDEMLTNREIALRMLDKMAFPDTRTIVKMLMQGYEPNSEPYLLMMLKAYQEYQLSDIRSKCRIFVPKGRVLLGCLDETDSLDYGQVYVKITMTKEELQDTNQTFFDKVDQTAAVVVQKVVVTRNPCLHPGDVRVLQAVYNPQLDNMGLVDCIVFPQKGRSHIIFLVLNMYILQEIQKFFVDYMINDTLGVISTAHLVYADREPAKARSPKCLELANLHSMAVDFAKTGSSAEMPRILKPKEFPDFMERWDRPMYVSTGILGKLYRAASRYIERPNTDPMDAEMLPQSAYDHDLQVKGSEAFLQAAEDYCNQYSERLSSLMNYYGAEHEDEILTGNLRSRSMHLQRDKKKYGEIKDRFLLGVKSLHKEVQGWFKSSCAESESLRMASAWYHVTYHPSYHSENRFLSFPWILSDVLLSIKATKSHKRQTGAGNSM